MKYDYKKLGLLLKEEREEYEYSRRNLAARVGISDTELKRIEDGERVAPNLITLIKLCEELDLNLQFLLEESDFIEFEEDRLYYVLVRNAELNLFKINAKNPGEAYCIMLNFLSENPIIEIDNSIPTIDFFVTENIEDINKKIEESELDFIDYTKDEEYFECPYCGKTINEDELD